MRILNVLAGGASALLAVATPDRMARAQSQQPVPCLPQQQPLITVPEIRSDTVNHRLKATLKLVDGVRTMWGFTGDSRCATQNLRYFTGSDPAHPAPWPTGPEPLPGPTFRARVGDLVEIAFYNQINPANFASTLDHSDSGMTMACDQYTSSTSSNTSKNQYGAPGGDVMPNCLHGSSTTNVHFHGTHTTPSTTGDNVLLFVRPANRTKAGAISPTEAQASGILAQIFKACEQHGPPKLWTDLPTAWQALQKRLVKQYDTSAPYQGNAAKLPKSMQLWPVDSAEIAGRLWPQYQVGASPYCFPLPKYDSATMRMGQAPGTHWYHAHKHGSTALNVANGMIGTFIIEGKYDDDLHRYYGANLKQQVMMLQQLSTAPFPLTNPGTGGPGANRPQVSVNGRLNPVVGMRPGEVQMWRIVNGAFRDAINFAYFQKDTATACTSLTPPARQTVQWRQIAQDGVQFALASYQHVGTINAPFDLSPANRADLLLKAPTDTGRYKLCIQRNVGMFVQAGAPGQPDAPMAMLTVAVGGAPLAMTFIPDNQFPTFPSFLKDIPRDSIKRWRELVFGAGFNTIDGKSFEDHTINQQMTLNTAEEWVVKNEANDKAHPFHIHINPFQVIEVFEPNSPEATTPGNACYVNPNDPTTFKPCPARQPAAPWIWWDTFGIPTGQQIALTCTKPSDCPANLQPYTKCTAATSTRAASCTEYIPGWFRMRSRFVDFTGQYVLHCHILIHEDRGMMQLIEVVSDKTPYTHR